MIEEMLKNKLAVSMIAACSKFSIEEITAFANSHGYPLVTP